MNVDIRDALAQNLTAAGILPITDIAFENTEFDPAGKSAYLAFFYFPALDQATGKTIASADDQTGFIQISVFTRLQNNDYGKDYLGLLDQIKAAFYSGKQLTYNTQLVELLDSDYINPSEGDGWYQGGLTINYQAFKQRV